MIINNCQVDEEDFAYLSKFSWQTSQDGYSYFWKSRRGKEPIRVYMHWIVMARKLRRRIPKGMEVDHINRKRYVNCRNNLRLVSHADNARNRTKVKRTAEEIEVDNLIIAMRRDGFSEKYIKDYVVEWKGEAYAYQLGSTAEIEIFERDKETGKLVPAKRLSEEQDSETERIITLMRQDGRSEEEIQAYLAE